MLVKGARTLWRTQGCPEGLLIASPKRGFRSAWRGWLLLLSLLAGYRTSSILAIPILRADDSNRAVGVIQVANKVSYDGQLEYFDEDDVDIMKMFASFVGPKLTSSMHSAQHTGEMRRILEVP
ncbi:unnamed protein product [Effrenium voratum]|nr:unnamed protein product [Effrenium voratum]